MPSLEQMIGRDLKLRDLRAWSGTQHQSGAPEGCTRADIWWDNSLLEAIFCEQLKARERLRWSQHTVTGTCSRQRLSLGPSAPQPEKLRLQTTCRGRKHDPTPSKPPNKTETAQRKKGARGKEAQRGRGVRSAVAAGAGALQNWAMTAKMLCCKNMDVFARGTSTGNQNRWLRRSLSSQHQARGSKHHPRHTAACSSLL